MIPAPQERTPLQEKMYRVIFGSDTEAGRRFDLWLIVAIIVSVAVVLFHSLEPINIRHGFWLYAAEWMFTLLFTAEYIARIYSSPNPRQYITSFYGIVDLLAIVPTYLGIFIPEANQLIILRLLRVLRIFKVLKLIRFINEGNHLSNSLWAARFKIVIFFTAIFVLNIIFGTIMYLIEGPENGFTSIPESIYWSIVTLTTVGYGDITPRTALGQGLASLIMVSGYAIIAVPTGIISAQLIKDINKPVTGDKRCNNCETHDHEVIAKFCKHCGASLDTYNAEAKDK
jgi:voltage-gated potassium channel